MLKRRTVLFLVCLLAVLSLISVCSCSPFYVIRAGWEEAGILLRRKPLEELIASAETDEERRKIFRLVLESREFSKKLGMKPGGSYTQFSSVDRDVLVYVLSASSKIAFQPVTWWFPIVGRVPYKGFFELEDAKSELKELSEEGYDVYLRGSPAFSTLGWFNDPLLSTMLNDDSLGLVNTVFHEILHNTVWIPNHVPFNESLANFVGAKASELFYIEKLGANSKEAILAKNRWKDDLVFANFIQQTIDRLEQLYQEKKTKEKTLEERDKILAEAAERWNAQVPSLVGDRYRGIAGKLNNAVLLALKVYLDRLEVFEQLFIACGESFEKFLEVISKVKDDVSKGEEDPYEAVARRTKELLRNAESVSL